MTDENKTEKPVNNALKDFLGSKATPQPTKNQVVASEDDMEDIVDDDDNMEDLPGMASDFKPVVSYESKQDKKDKFGIKPKLAEVDGKILTIASVEFGLPKRKEMINGSLVAVQPKKTQTSGKFFYETKLKIRFVENNFTEFVPSAKYWCNPDKNNPKVLVINPEVSVDMGGNSHVTQLFRMVIVKLAKAQGKNFELIQTTVNEKITLVAHPNCFKEFEEFADKVSIGQILDFLVGKKVLMKDSTGVYNNKPWNRADIVSILD